LVHRLSFFFDISLELDDRPTLIGLPHGHGENAQRPPN
jgi:hypothetical protein